jgi:hypothetical protein
MALRMRWLTAVVVVFAFALSGCGKAFGGRVVYEGDYPAYNSAAEMVDKATLVIEATVAGPHVDMLYPSDDDGAHVEGTGVVVTVWSATITAIHKGSNKPGDAVDVKQMGGEFDGVVYEQHGGVAFREGVTYLLFLETYPDAAASLLNPTQAQYEVAEDGSYRPVSPDNRITVSRADL